MTTDPRTLPKPAEHLVRFFRHDEELVDIVVGFAARARLAGDAVIVISTAEHRRAYELGLRERGIDPAEAIAAGQLVFLDAAATLREILVDGSPAADRVSEVVGKLVLSKAAESGCVSVYGEMVSLLWAQGNVAGAMELEGFWNEFIHGTDLSVLCAYQTSILSAETFERDVAAIRDVHTATLEPIPTCAGGIVASEARRAIDWSDAAPTTARAFSLETLARWGHEELAPEVASIVTELVTNAVIHARTDVEVSLSLTDSTLRISVRDRSHALPAPASPDHSSTSGRGMLIVAEMASRWGIEPSADGKIVWAELKPLTDHPAQEARTA